MDNENVDPYAADEDFTHRRRFEASVAGFVAGQRFYLSVAFRTAARRTPPGEPLIDDRTGVVEIRLRNRNGLRLLGHVFVREIARSSTIPSPR